MCVCVSERERQGHSTVESAFLIAACLQTHTSIITVSFTEICFPLRLELVVKLTILLTVYINLKLTFMVSAVTFPTCLWCSANHNALGQLTNQSRLSLSEGGALLKMTRLREAGHRGTTIIYSINITACQHIFLHQIHKIMIFKIASYPPFNVWSF